MAERNNRQFLTGRLVTDGTVIDDGVLAIERDRIRYAGPAADFDAAFNDGGWDRMDSIPPDATIVPGLVDLHCHGGAGGDFSAGEEDASRRAIDFLHRNGTTTVLASLVTASRADLERGIAVQRVLSEEGLLAGIHLEGPYLSSARCGAQDPAWLRLPDPAETSAFVESAGGWLKTMTYAPELPGAAALVTALATAGVVPSLGHTDASAETAATSLGQALNELQRAVSPSARPTVTHLFNGMPSLHHRSPGPVLSCLRAARAGNAVIELIADNVHLDPQTVLTIFELVGAGNIALVTDAMAATGLGNGIYTLGGSKVTVRDSVATLESGGTLAGGTATLLQVLQHAVAAGVPLADAVLAATAVPASVLALSEHIGSLRSGLRADAVVLSSDLQLLSVLRAGERLPAPEG